MLKYTERQKQVELPWTYKSQNQIKLNNKNCFDRKAKSIIQEVY